MNTKHTPGPWTVSPSARASTLTRIFSVNEERLVASASGPGLSESGEAEANARLIAAAPELLAALQTLVQMTGNAGQLERFLDTTARAVIAKATNPIP